MLEEILDRHHQLLEIVKEKSEQDVLAFWNSEESKVLRRYLTGNVLTFENNEIQASAFLIADIMFISSKEELKEFFKIYIKNISSIEALDFAYSTLIYDPRVDLIASRIFELNSQSLNDECALFLKSEAVHVESIWNSSKLLQQYLTKGVHLGPERFDESVITCGFRDMVTYYEVALKSGRSVVIDAIWKANPRIWDLFNFKLDDSHKRSASEISQEATNSPPAKRAKIG